MKQKHHPIFISIVSLFSIFTIACAQMKRSTLKQIDALEKEKASRTPVQQKIESHLLQALRNARGEKNAATLPSDASGVDIDKNGLVNVDIAAEITDTLLQNIKKLGGEITYPSKEYHTVRAKIPLLKVETVAGYNAVKFIQPAAIAHNNKMTPQKDLQN